MSRDDRLIRLGLYHLKDKPEELQRELDRRREEARREDEAWEEERKKIQARYEAAQATLKPCPGCGGLFPAQRVGRELQGLCPRCLANAAREAVAAILPPATPARIGPYDVLDILGEGGMGVVYRAWQRTLGRGVALKVMTPRLADHPIFKARFEREGRALAAVDDPNVVRVFDAGRDGDRLFIAMELVVGRSLQSWMDQGPLPEDRLRAILRDAARGLHAVHSAGLIHRDVKPGNILVTSSGAAKIGDFGLAFDPDATVAVTGTGEFLGTPQYVSPEHVAGRSLDGRADLYAIGVILVQALTGRFPFAAPNLAGLLYEHLHVPPRLEGISDRWLPLVTRLLSKDPAGRPATAAELARELE